jgi:hypothetical protein
MKRTAQEIVSVMDKLSDVAVINRGRALPHAEFQDRLWQKIDLVAECVRDLARIEAERSRSISSTSNG